METGQSTLKTEQRKVKQDRGNINFRVTTTIEIIVELNTRTKDSNVMVKLQRAQGECLGTGSR